MASKLFRSVATLFIGVIALSQTSETLMDQTSVLNAHVTGSAGTQSADVLQRDCSEKEGPCAVGIAPGPECCSPYGCKPDGISSFTGTCTCEIENSSCDALTSGVCCEGLGLKCYSKPTGLGIVEKTCLKCAKGGYDCSRDEKCCEGLQCKEAIGVVLGSNLKICVNAE